MWWDIIKRFSSGGPEGGNLTGRNRTTVVSEESLAQGKVRTEMLAPWISGPSQDNYQGIDVIYNVGLKGHLKNLKHIDNVILMGYYLRNYIPKNEKCEGSEMHYNFFENMLTGRNLRSPSK